MPLSLRCAKTPKTYQQKNLGATKGVSQGLFLGPTSSFDVSTILIKLSQIPPVNFHAGNKAMYC